MILFTAKKSHELFTARLLWCIINEKGVYIVKAKKCKHCNEEVAKNAKICPKCGCKLGLPTFVKILILIIIILACVVGCVSSCSNAVNEAVEETISSYADKNGNTSFKLNESFENDYEKITMTEVDADFKDYSEYFGPADGNKIVLVKFEVENVGEDDEIYVSSLSFNGYADGVAVDQYYYIDDEYNDLSATIGVGKKAVGYVAYEISSDTEEFVIEYNADFWQDGTTIEFIVI